MRFLVRSDVDLQGSAKPFYADGCSNDEWYQEIDALMDKTATVQPLALVARSAS